MSNNLPGVLIQILPLISVDPKDVENLLDLAFGADRHGRTAYRLREGMSPIAELSLAALEDGALIGSIQCWPVQLTDAGGDATALILVGPVAVRPDRQRSGIGRRLMEAALERADAIAADPMVLIGDAIYYERFFGFSARHTGGWTLPGPVDRDRLLARTRGDQPLPRQAALGPRRVDQALVPGGD